MKNRFLMTMLLGICLMCLSKFHYALDPQKKITQFMHDVWEIEQGLPQNSVLTMLQTRDGYLWLGTEEGLVRFDGVRFKVYNKKNVQQLSSNRIRALHEDRQGNLWMGTHLGDLTCLKDGKFHTYTKKKDFSDTIITAIYEDREGSLWIGTDGRGLARLAFDKKDGKTTLTPYTTKQGLSNDYVRCIYEDSNGCLWIGTDKGGVNRLDRHIKNGKITFTAYTTKQGLSDDYVRSIYEDREGSLWVGTYGGGLNHLDRDKKDANITFTTYTTKQGLSNDYVHCIYEDSDGCLWIGTLGGGLNRMDRHKKNGKITFTTFTTKQGLSNDVVWSIYEDREGSLWIGTIGGGLNRLADGNFTTYTTREGLSHDSVLSIHQDREGNVWCGTYGGGLNRLKDGKFTVFTTKTGLIHNEIGIIYEDRKGTLWIGTRGGLNRLDRHKKDGTLTFTPYTTKQGLSNDKIVAICEDREGNLWIGTHGGGLNRLDQPGGGSKRVTFTTFTKEMGLASNYVLSVYEDRKGTLWIGSRRGLTCLKDGKFHNYTTEQGLSNNIVRRFYEDREGALWIGTDSGLNRLKHGKFTAITIKDGLFDDAVHKILEDDSGNFWMSCNNGIFRVPWQELNDFCDGKRKTVGCISYDETDGMKSRECNGMSQSAGCKTRDGKLWFSTIKGMVMIDPNHIKMNQKPPPVKIEEIIVDNKTVQLPFSSNQEKLILPPGKEQFEIHYTALSLLVPEKVRFKYKLDGVNKDWLDVGTRRTAYYTKLPPGDYTFRVKACNNDGIWNEAGAAVSFYLKPYFYQTWWFYTMCAFGALFLVFGIYRWRVKQITAHKIELERLVEERTRQLEESGKELEKLSLVASETHNAVAIMDAKGNMEWINAGATRMYGYTLEQVFKEKGRNIVEVSSHPHIRELLNKFITQPEPLLYETLYTTRDGKKIWDQITWTPVLDEEGNLIKIVSIGSDITQLKESKEQIDKQNKEIREQNERILKQSEKLKEAIKIAREEREAADAANRAKGEFLARMSHEIRTPINSVIGFSEILMDTDLSDEQLDYAGIIGRSGEALITLIDDILDFSRIEAGKLTFDSTDFDPEVMAFDVCELTTPRIEDRPIDIQCRVGNRVPAYVKQDPGRFRQVLVNLMGNAAKFTEKGEIQLSIDVEEEEEDRLKLHAMVRDTGIGIPPEKQGAIFELFQQVDGSVTRRFGGTGLGLAICKQIAKHMGGDIRMESTLGQGSTFHFHAWVERSKKTPAEKAEMIDLTGKRILIVDDNLNNLDILENILKKHGISVVKQTSGERVIPILEENLEKGTPFDLCILDLMMPGLTGYEVASRIRALDSPVSGTLLLAFSSSSYRQAKKYREYGFDAFLPKPTPPTKLLRVIEQLFRPGKTGTKPENREKSELVTQHSVIEHAKHSVRILLAEDNPVNRKLAVFMLTRGGYQLDVAENGKEAVEKYTSAPDKYDLIFMDIQMPRMDGREATRKIRETESASHIPIIAMTAESMKGDREKCLEAGMDDYIAKPIRREIVFEMIKKWVITKTNDE